jgi:hypothetical protein
VASGWNEGRPSFEETIRLAREIGGVVIAESVDRFIRASHYWARHCPSAQPTEEELQALMDLADGVPLVTVLHPDTPWREVRSHQTRRGQRYRQRFGGRPRRTASRDDRRLRQIIARHGGQITIPQLMHACRAYRSSARDAEAALIALGLHRVPIATRGRPMIMFCQEIRGNESPPPIPQRTLV